MMWVSKVCRKWSSSALSGWRRMCGWSGSRLSQTWRFGLAGDVKDATFGFILLCFVSRAEGGPRRLRGGFGVGHGTENRTVSEADLDVLNRQLENVCTYVPIHMP